MPAMLTQNLDLQEFDPFEAGYPELVSPFARAYFGGIRHEHDAWMEQGTIAFPVKQKSRHEYCRELAWDLINKHPEISVYQGIFGGIPHIRGVRLTVGDILGHLYVLGSIAAILERYGNDVSEEQIKEAIAYAQDFLEEALHP